MKFDDSKTSKEYVSEEVGKIGIRKEIDLKAIRREQVKIILGLSCFFIPNFATSKTAVELRNYLWGVNGNEKVKNIPSTLYPFNVTKEQLPSFSVDGNVVRVVPNEGMEIEYILKSLNIEKEHIFAVYKHKKKLRLFLSIFGKINAVIDTLESSSHFFLGPVSYKDTAYVIHPKNKKHEKIDIDHSISIVPSLASAKLAGFFSSKPDLFDI